MKFALMFLMIQGLQFEALAEGRDSTHVAKPIGYFSILQDEKQSVSQAKRPPLSLKRIAGELLWGDFCGWAGLLGGVIIADKIISPKKDSFDYPSNKAMYVGYTTGILCMSAAVSQIGNKGNERGSFLGALGGSLVGVGLTAVILKDNMNPYPLLFSVPVACSTIGFNLTSSYKDVAVLPAYNVQNKAMSLSLIIKY